MPSDVYQTIRNHLELNDEGTLWARSKEHSSLVIDRKSNRFYWASRNVGPDRRGDVADFYAALYGVSREEGIKLANKHGEPYIPMVEKSKKKEYHQIGWDLAIRHNKALAFNNGAGYAWWASRGVNRNTVNLLRLGQTLEHGVLWYTIPVPAASRLYLANYKLRRSESGMPRYRQYMSGLETALYVPYASTDKSDTLVLVGGEIKAIVLGQYGFPTISSSSGADTWQLKWNEYTKQKHVYIALDPGEEEQARKIKDSIDARSVVVAKMKHKPDDALVLHGWDVEQLKESIYGMG